MSELEDQLATAFESAGYDVTDVSKNRDTFRVGVLEDEASASDLRKIVHEVLDEADIFGLDVTTESDGEQDEVTTVVSFRYRG